MWVIPIASKDGDELIRAMKGIVGNMGQPKKIYSDQEPALVGNKFQEWLVDNKILHITTLTHAPSAERAIRTFKDLMTRRLEAPKNENVPWHGNVRLAVLFQYNQKTEQRTIGMTPYDATEKKNEETVRAMLELNAVQKRKYPDVKVGDYVKVYKKKDKLDKERISVWSKSKYEVEEIKEEKDQTFYYLSGHEEPLLRHENLLAKS